MNVPNVVTGLARRVGRLGWLWLRDPEGRREERAATSLVMFIVFFPLIVGSFGLGVDVARNIWVRTSLQNAVDTAVVGGAAVTTSDGTGQVHINPGPARVEIRDLYALNRQDNPGLKCFGGPRCWKEPTEGQHVGGVVASQAVGGLEANFTVTEQTNNAFLWLLGQRTQEYNLKGHAEVSRINE